MRELHLTAAPFFIIFAAFKPEPLIIIIYYEETAFPLSIHDFMSRISSSILFLFI